MPAPDGAIGGHQRGRVRGMGAAGAPEHVAGELVEQEHQGERAVRIELPFVQVAPGRSFVREEETGPAGRVESLVRGEPAFPAGLAPEGQDLRRACELCPWTSPTF